MNKAGYCYMILFGDSQYHPEDHYRSERLFDYIADLRESVPAWGRGIIWRVSFPKNQDIPNFKMV